MNVNRCEAAIRVNGDRCVNGGRSVWRVHGEWDGAHKAKTDRDVHLCGTHLRAMVAGFYLWDNARVLVTRPKSRRVAA